MQRALPSIIAECTKQNRSVSDSQEDLMLCMLAVRAALLYNHCCRSIFK